MDSKTKKLGILLEKIFDKVVEDDEIIEKAYILIKMNEKELKEKELFPITKTNYFICIKCKNIKNDIFCKKCSDYSKFWLCPICEEWIVFTDINTKKHMSDHKETEFHLENEKKMNFSVFNLFVKYPNKYHKKLILPFYIKVKELKIVLLYVFLKKNYLNTNDFTNYSINLLDTADDTGYYDLCTYDGVKCYDNVLAKHYFFNFDFCFMKRKEESFFSYIFSFNKEIYDKYDIK